MLLDYPGLSKGTESQPGRVCGGVADNHVVEQLDVEGLGRWRLT